MDLTKRIERLEARQAIMDCLTRYTRGVDRMDRELVLSAYHPDAEDHHIDFQGDPAGFVEWLWPLLENTKSQTSHLILNHSCDLNDDLTVAHCETHFIFIGGTSEKLLESAGGRYIDRLENRSGEWRIAQRVLAMDWLGETAKPGDASMGFIPNLHVHTSRDRDDISYLRPLTVAAKG